MHKILFIQEKYDWLLYNPYISGVTTMGSDRENPGAPNLNGPNGGPQV
jgi:hypothetical protein